ncbi:MAG: peptide ABC transporter substrate-binding protein [Phycisphaerae bacterium]
MLRTLLLVLGLPSATLLVFLALAAREERADFVFATEEPRTIDPHRVSWLAEIQVANALFEGLTRVDPRTLQPEPAVAASWERSADRLEYTFHLRPDARWSNGERVVAEHFRYAWLRALDPATQSQYAALLFVIDGAERFYRARLDGAASTAASRGAESVGVDAPDADTLRVRLAGPCPYFLDLTSFPTFAPVYPPLLERWRAGGRAADAERTLHLWTRAENIISNGAFVLTRWDFKRRLWLERNAHYWDREHVALRTIEVYITADPNAALLGFETGRIDLYRQLSTPVARVLLEQQRRGERRDFRVGPRLATYFYRVNCRRPPLDNPDLRKALSLAIDREAICEQVMGLGETPAYTYVPRGALAAMPRTTRDGRTILYAPPTGLGEGLAAAEREALAREHLRRSGFAARFPSRAIEISFAANPDYQRVAEAMQAMWERVLGVRVDLRAIEGKVLSERIRNLDYDVARSDWFGDYLDPGTFLDMFTSTSGQNRTGWSDATYDGWIAAATREPDDERRYGLFQQAERRLCVEELPIIPVYFRSGNMLLRARFEGLDDNIRDLLPIHRARPVAFE